MKKFLSMVMAAAMVVSLVPATAFAAAGDVKATAKVVDAQNYTEKEIKDKQISDAELQLTFTTTDYTAADFAADIDLTLDNAYFVADTSLKATDMYIKVDGDIYEGVEDSGDSEGNRVIKFERAGLGDANVTITLPSIANKADVDEVTLTVSGKVARGAVLAVGLDSVMDKITKGKTATVTVDSDDVTITNGDDLVYASVEGKGIKASVKDTVDIATEEIAELKEIKVEPTVGDNFGAVVADENKAELTLRLPSGYEFAKKDTTDNLKVNGVAKGTVAEIEDDEITIKASDLNLTTDTWKITGLWVEADTAKAGATGTVKIALTGSDTVTVEAIKVVDYGVVMSVDEDEDVPVIYSGVDADNTGITDDSDHESLEVTVEETFVGAFDEKKDLTFTLPDGVYVAGTDGVDSDGTDFLSEDQFKAAYDEGDRNSFVFKKRTMEESTDDKYETNFTLTLVADPNFEGDVVLKMEGDGVETQEVTIAKFVKPFTVEAQQNDMQIDYRNTEIPTSVVIKEAEAGLWDKNTDFKLALDKIEFDDDAKVTVDDKSGMEIKTVKTKGGAVSFEVDTKSDDEPAAITVSGLTLYMDRNLPAGAYDLEVASVKMLGIDVLASDYDEDNDVEIVAKDAGLLRQEVYAKEKETVAHGDDTIADVNDDFVSYTAKAGFVNIVTAGREDTDSFTTKVVVPVGEKYVISGETKQEIPVPAYINADGYTMLPLRAVSVALGINSNNVLWDQATRTATVMYGSKIISMTYGQKVVYVNAAPIPASTSVEIKENRMFLGLRDLGNALGVTDITWDAATKTATLNGNK